jgi:hypothetical protein
VSPGETTSTTRSGALEERLAVGHLGDRVTRDVGGVGGADRVGIAEQDEAGFGAADDACSVLLRPHLEEAPDPGRVDAVAEARRRLADQVAANHLGPDVAKRKSEEVLRREGWTDVLLAHDFLTMPVVTSVSDTRETCFLSENLVLRYR